MDVKILFPKNSQPDTAKATIAERLCQAASLCINLPDYIEVHFANLGPGIYGEAVLKPGINRKITVNLDLSVKEIIYPITHELIHLSQMYEGKLAVSRTGLYVWEGKTYKVDPAKISYKEYMQLPWEYDVSQKEVWLLKAILNIS
jgi:hypothetical protein